MPRPTPSGALSAFGSARNFMKVVREMSFDEERKQAETLPRLLVIAADADVARQIGDELTGAPGHPSVAVAGPEAASRDLGAYDAVVVLDASGSLVKTATNRSLPSSTKVYGFPSMDSDWANQLREKIASGDPDLAPALGRWFPAFRSIAASVVINSTAMVNGEFALVSN